MVAQPRLFAALLLLGSTSSFLAPPGAARHLKALRAAADEGKSLRKRLWDKIRKKDEAEGTTSEEGSLDKGENDALYAALQAKKAELAETAGDRVDDREIYDAIAAKADFPMVSKKLSEALQNRSLTSKDLPPVLAPMDYSDFAPSSGQTPGEVISGVLEALRAGRTDDADEPNAGVDVLLRFMSPASSFGSEPVNDDDFIAFVLDSEYDILLRWEQMSFSGAISLNQEGTQAYQTVRLLDDDTGAWVKTKWALSLRDAADCKEMCDTSADEGYWLIDNVIVSAGLR